MVSNFPTFETSTIVGSRLLALDTSIDLAGQK